MDFAKEYIDITVLFVLGAMSFISLWFSIERVIFFAKLKLDSYKSKQALSEDLSKNLIILYIIYSNAPYIGLLGTVVGIMITFYDIGNSGMDSKVIVIGLSLALKATALGLIVAIPTLVTYNIFLRKVSVLLNRFDIRD